MGKDSKIVAFFAARHIEVLIIMHLPRNIIIQCLQISALDKQYLQNTKVADPDTIRIPSISGIGKVVLPLLAWIPVQ